MMDNKNLIIRLLGTMPENSNQNYRRERYLDFSSYYIDRIFYELEPGEEVSSLLMIPRKNKPCPAIIACHQHNDEYFVGKSEVAGLYETPNSFGRTLCDAGYVVFCPDFLGFEDRRPKEYERKANHFLESDGYERYLFIDYLLKGSTLQAKNIFDLSRAIDILERLPEVDSSRLGVCGHSLGGQESIWLGFFDSRIKAVVSNCGVARIKDLQSIKINHNYAMYLPSLFAVGLDMDDVVSALAPKPLCILQGEEDKIFPSSSVSAVIEKAKARYTESGYPERFVAKFFPGTPHIFSEKAQQEMVSFLGRFL